ncbi:MAG: hypothetical protein ACK40M_03260 [Flavobacteriales bacterium]|nr:hypothetical protein [Flavobacteriales bacterium]HRE73904.1 hypothetical protein [Flavobacteriales bacterium]HRJ35767.1 hypothetical protein [Flavobacteriales bacterium]HRJ38321.1 hypothetical protein [Flavobacteriales bacterium]
MQSIRKFFRLLEYASITGILIMALLFFTGHLSFSWLKFFVALFDVLVVLFIFLNCTDDYKTPFEKLFRLIGWLVLLTGIVLIFVIYESVRPDAYWHWFNTILVTGLFAAQLSEINELKRSNDVLKLLNLVVTLGAYTVLIMTIHGFPMNFVLLFILLGVNMLTMLATVLTGKLP